MIEDEIIGALVKRREELGLTRSEVARRSGLSLPTISANETGGKKRSCSLYTLRHWAEALGFSVQVHPDLGAER